MAKITAPVPGYNGQSAGVTFENGQGYSDRPDTLSWFKQKGYTVEEEDSKQGPTTAQEPQEAPSTQDTVKEDTGKAPKPTKPTKAGGKEGTKHA